MLEVGMKAPDFTLTDKDGSVVSLSDFFGKKVVLYFYPKDNTPGCTRQACAFAGAYNEFKSRNFEVIGISKDSVASHLKFAQKYDLYPGCRLTTSNVYFVHPEFARDIFYGENASRRYVDFMPIVQLFLGKKDEKIRAKTDLFSEDVWSAVKSMGYEYLQLHPELCRDGFFYFKK